MDGRGTMQLAMHEATKKKVGGESTWSLGRGRDQNWRVRSVPAKELPNIFIIEKGRVKSVETETSSTSTCDGIRMREGKLWCSYIVT